MRLQLNLRTLLHTCMAGRVVVDKMTLIRAEAEALVQQHANDQKEIMNMITSDRVRAERAFEDALKTKKAAKSSMPQERQRLADNTHSKTASEEAVLSANNTPIKRIHEDRQDAHDSAKVNGHCLTNSIVSRNNTAEIHGAKTKASASFIMVKVLLYAGAMVLVLAPYAVQGMLWIIGPEGSMLPRVY
jgi:hypothetical protein